MILRGPLKLPLIIWARAPEAFLLFKEVIWSCAVLISLGVFFMVMCVHVYESPRVYEYMCVSRCVLIYVHLCEDLMFAPGSLSTWKKSVTAHKEGSKWETGNGFAREIHDCQCCLGCFLVKNVKNNLNNFLWIRKNQNSELKFGVNFWTLYHLEIL